MEYMDPSSDLLRRFSMEVPGTYQHSLVLGNLAETCAQSIGANGLFCRAATLYHDIGKIGNPQFYTENQQGSVNIHQLLTPLESAQVIISHITDGEVIARKAHLPQAFIDIIREHHGTTLVYYFYRKQLELKGGRVEEVDEKQFRYPGPKPRTKESAIIMICDSIEAATRSLEEINEQTLGELVNRLVSEKAEDGQFDECYLTFEELGRVKKVLVKTLLLSHHVRVKYPKKEKPGAC
jgi:putative nucleotidyltransferase with HDIG domain